VTGRRDRGLSSHGRQKSRPLRVAIAAALATATVASAPLTAIASSYAASLGSAAAVLSRAAKSHAAVPAVHLPPAPLGGPPRFSPSVDDWLQAELAAARAEKRGKSRDRDLAAVASTLNYLAAAARPGGGAAGPRADARSVAAQVLADPAYHKPATAPAPPPKQTIWEKILVWIGRQLARLFGGLVEAAQGAPLIGTIFAIVLIALAALGVGYVAYRVADGFVVRRLRIVSEGEALPVDASAADLYASACAAAKDGRYAHAIGLLFRSSLMLLDGAGRVPYDATRTAGEYRRLVQRRARGIATPFEALARAFTLAAFAEAPVGPPDWADAQAAYRIIEPALGAR
jgi:hypothetical protein